MSTFGRVLDRVRDEIGDDLIDAHRIGFDDQRVFGKCGAQRDVLLVGQRLHDRERLPREVAQIEVLFLEHDLSGGDARQIEQVVHQPREMTRLALDELRMLVIEMPVFVVHLRREENRAERIAQLVSEDGEEPIALVNALFQLVHQIAHFVLALACA